MSTSDPRLQDIRSLISTGQLDAAYALLLVYIDSEPLNAEAWYLVGQCAPDDDTSIQALQRAVEIQPDFIEASVLLAGLKGDAEIVTYPTRPEPDDEE
ncbi:MAG: hypothetical protein K8L97_31325 [Anaerolineae bacterium]|nr:hypothetical protein [Anaerolineae bacterium]